MAVIEIGLLPNVEMVLPFHAAEIGELTNLTSLILSNNNLTSIPAEIGQLINLTDLYLDNNSLTTIPQAVCDLATVYGTILLIDIGVTCAP
jgi:Leucine-rich repeat (LRR) protein